VFGHPADAAQLDDPSRSGRRVPGFVEHVSDRDRMVACLREGSQPAVPTFPLELFGWVDEGRATQPGRDQSHFSAVCISFRSILKKFSGL